MESGSFHVSVKEWDLEIRGIRYTTTKRKVWVYMPSKKGELDGKPCEFPIFNLIKKEEQQKFVKQLRRAFIDFMKTDKYKEYETPLPRKRQMVWRDVKPLPVKK